jgi:aspartyl-tRNA(Asn)/glutamyl-tRNA(Gln) amidotransferase subunit A
MDECHHLNVRLVELFHQVPLICTPTVGGQTGFVGGQGFVNGQETPFWVSFTYPFNMTRSPAGSVCAGFTAAGMPVGLQMVGPQHADVVVLRGLALLEDVLALDPIAPI